MKITVVGSGIVGRAVGKGFVRCGHDVLFYDIDGAKADALAKEGFEATADIKKAAAASDIFFVCVPTPTKNENIDLSIIKSAAIALAKSLGSKKSYFLIVVKSTVVPTTTEKLLIPLVEKHSGKKAGKDFGVCVNPEFLRAKHAFGDFTNPDRIVIGALDKKSGEMLSGLYEPFSCPVVRTDLKTAEIIKYANNCFYAAKISFFNEFHLVCKKLGIDSNLVREAVQMDRHYSTHPSFHGKSFDGACLPKDLSAFISFCSSRRIHDPVLLRAVRKVNESDRLKTKNRS